MRTLYWVLIVLGVLTLIFLLVLVPVFYTYSSDGTTKMCLSADKLIIQKPILIYNNETNTNDPYCTYGAGNTTLTNGTVVYAYSIPTSFDNGKKSWWGNLNDTTKEFVLFMIILLMIAIWIILTNMKSNEVLNEIEDIEDIEAREMNAGGKRRAIMTFKQTELETDYTIGVGTFLRQNEDTKIWIEPLKPIDVTDRRLGRHWIYILQVGKNRNVIGTNLVTLFTVNSFIAWIGARNADDGHSKTLGNIKPQSVMEMLKNDKALLRDALKGNLTSKFHEVSEADRILGNDKKKD